MAILKTKGGGGGGTPSYIRKLGPFLGVQNFEFQYFGFYLKKMYSLV